MDSNQSHAMNTGETPSNHIMVSKSNVGEAKSPKGKPEFERKMTNQDAISSQDMNSSNFGIMTNHLNPKNLSKREETYSAGSGVPRQEGDNTSYTLQQKI